MAEPRSLPEAEVGVRSAAWWGLVVGLAVLGSFLATLISSYLYLLVEADAWPPRGVPRPSLPMPLLATAALAASAILLRWAWPGARLDRLGTATRPLGAILILALAFMVVAGVDLIGTEFRPWDHAYGSAYFVLVGFAWILVASAVPLGGIVLVRLATARGDGRMALLGLRSFILYWGFTVVSWLLVFFTVYVVPHLGALS
jgi:heme/copper-type cytochrome/quinol oxidase subunit 3